MRNTSISCHLLVRKPQQLAEFLLPAQSRFIIYRWDCVWWLNFTKQFTYTLSCTRPRNVSMNESTSFMRILRCRVVDWPVLRGHTASRGQVNVGARPRPEAECLSLHLVAFPCTSCIHCFIHPQTCHHLSWI